MIKNLLYHIYPIKEGNVWQWNVNQLLRRIDQFNGQRIVGVVTDSRTDSFETVKAAFKGTVTNFIHHRNDPTLGEVVNFEEMMRRVENIDPRQITFYAHAKGVKYKPGTQPMVQKWTRVLYQNMLDYPSLIEDSLSKHSIVGTFKKVGNCFGGMPPAWHYAGTFFWFKNSQIFNHQLWNRIPRSWWGVEAWPGVVISDEGSDCLFIKAIAAKLQMYGLSTWHDFIDPRWKAWRIKYANLHRTCSYSELLNSIGNKNDQIIVSGPQRSGTTIAAKMLATDLNLLFLDETKFDTHDFNKFQARINQLPKFVMQAPTMSAYLHQIKDCIVVWMKRNVQDVLRSQKRIGWKPEDEEIERDRYFDHSHDPIAVVKNRAWDLFQRAALEDAAYDLDYESLKNHRLWIDKDGRKNFGNRQTYPYCG